MKTRLPLLFILATFLFLSASGQRSVSARSGLMKQASSDNQFPSVTTDGKNILQPELDRLVDSIHQEDWDSINWVLKTREHKFRNSLGYVTEDLYVVKNSGTGLWNNYIHYLYAYDGANPDFITQSGELWTNAANWLQYQFSQYVAKNKPDSTFTKDWNITKQKFTSGLMTLTQYDTLDSIIQSLTRKYDTTSNGWINQYKNIYTYIAPHLLSEQIFQAWRQSTNAWVNINRKVNTYDTSNFLISQMGFVWNDTAYAWDSSSRISYVNDLLGKPLTSLSENFDSYTHVWIPYIQTVFTYSPLEWLLNERQQVYNPITSNFDDYYLTYFTYTPGGLLQSTTGNFWKPTTNEWVTDSYYAVDSTMKFLESYTKFHDNSTYDITGGNRTTQGYNSKNQLNNLLKQEWSTSLNDWLNAQQTNYSYNQFKLLDTIIDQVWNIPGSVWTNFKRSIYYYSEPYSIQELGNGAKYCQFANPMKRGTVVNCPGFLQGEPYALKIYSLSGMLVYSLNFSGGNPVAVTPSVANGMYLLQFTDGKGRILSTSKVLILN